VIERRGCAAFGDRVACHRKGWFSNKEIAQFRLAGFPGRFSQAIRDPAGEAAGGGGTDDRRRGRTMKIA